MSECRVNITGNINHPWMTPAQMSEHWTSWKCALFVTHMVLQIYFLQRFPKTFYAFKSWVQTVLLKKRKPLDGNRLYKL